MQGNFIICPSCGKTLSSERKFCIYCGEIIEIGLQTPGSSLTEMVEKAIKKFPQKEYDNQYPEYRKNYQFTLTHDKLNKQRIFKGKNLDEVYQKALLQAKIWDEMWDKRCKLDNDRHILEDKKNIALRKTKEAAKTMEEIENILLSILNKDCKINWEYLKDFSKYDKPKPIEPKLENLEEEKIPLEPIRSDARYQPNLNLLEKLFSSLAQKKINKLITLFEKEHEEWMEMKKKILNNNLSRKEKANTEYIEKKNKYNLNIKEWEKQRNIFINNQNDRNEAIDRQRDKYININSEGIIDYCDMVLINSIYPDSFPKEFEIEYIPETKMIIIDYLLPNLDHIPKLKEIKYIKSRNELKEYYLSDSSLFKIYNNLLYNITLRSLYELFYADIICAIDSIVYNGIVKRIDKAFGKEMTDCILSIHANKEEFMDINLSAVDPKECFKKLKGVSASKLYALSAIPPIMKINKEDARFIDAYGVADSLDDSVNIAAMDWQDFEHLIREIFEKEFQKGGGEVKITRASRDAGVDAVAFDPDPIRGGKIVIQAKRYVNIVGVASVRDLYGTIVNEGATKGILVTTSNYGSDAYEFARGKPITLLNGSNLLHLLEKHGYRAKIDLIEAKQLLTEQDKNS